MRCRPRYSQIPASGCSADLAAWLPSHSSRSKQAFVAGPRQPAIEEHRHGGENDAAIGVILDLRRRRVADPNRSVAAVALQVGSDAFLQRYGRHDAVYRPQGLVGVRSDAQGEGDEILHRLRRTDAVERLHHEIGVAQPAIAIVPGPARPGRFRDRGRMRRDDAAGLLEAAQLERDRGADDGLLPIIGNRQSPDPVHPIVAGAVAELPARRRQSAGEGFIGPEHEMDRVCQDKGRLRAR